MSILKLDNISKTYNKGVTALSNFSFESKNNELVVILGASGSGKTTLLRILSGLDFEYDGQLFIDDKCINGVDPIDREVALVFQNYALYPQMDVYNNLAIALRQKSFYLPILDKNKNQIYGVNKEKLITLKKSLKGKSKEDKKKIKIEIKNTKKIKDVPLFSYQRISEDEINKRIVDISSSLEMDDFINQRASTLSGGQKQRVALAKALIKEPKLLLLDEPLSNLDPKTRGKAREIILFAHEKYKCTTLLVSHNQNDAFALADRVIILNEGRIEQIGTPDEVYKTPNNLFVANILGVPPINKIKCDVVNNDLFTSSSSHTKINVKNKNLLINHESVTLALRAENIKICENGLYQGTLLKTELLGKNLYAQISAFDEVLYIKVDEIPAKSGVINFNFDLDKIIIFDTNGNRI